MTDEALRVRDFWFGAELTGALPGPGEMGPALHALSRRSGLWFNTDPQQTQERDRRIATEFSDLLERAARGELEGWSTSPRRRLSLIIVLDQFPRHIFRGTPRAFACDPQALALTLSGMQCAADGALNVVERIFFYMPLQHSEVLEVQEESVAAFTRLAAECAPELHPVFEAARQSATAHRELIARFGRFPHRNRILGRASTPEELRYLTKDEETFGQ